MSQHNEIEENEESGEAQAPVKKIDPGFARNIKVIGGVLAVAIIAVVVVIMSFRSKAKVDADVNMNAAQSGASQQVNSEQTPAMQQKLASKQAEEATIAKAEGKVYIPKEPIGKTEPIEPPKPPVDRFGPSTAQQANIAIANDPQDTLRREGLQRQLAAMYPEAPGASGYVRQTLEADKGGASAAQAASPAAARQNIDSNGSSAGKKIITALEIFPGVMANPINVGQGKTAFASARIVSGKFSGAYLIGTATLTDEESIDTNFTSMRFGDKSYKISAKVLDEDTADAGLRGDIDRRVLQRYVLPIALGMVQGYVTAKSQTGSSVVIGSGGATTASVPPPTEDQAINAGVAVGLQQAHGDIQKEAQKPIRGATKRNAPMGILFLSDVVEGNAQ